MNKLQIQSIRQIGASLFEALVNTDRCDRPRAERSVSDFYISCGRRPPRAFLWFSSPSRAISAAMLCAFTESGRMQMSEEAKTVPLPDEMTLSLSRTVMEPVLFPLTSQWRSWLGNLDLNESSICYTRSMLDLSQFTNDTSLFVYREHMEALLRAAPNVRILIGQVARAEHDIRFKKFSSFQFLHDAVEDIIGGTDDDVFLSELYRTVELLKRLPERQQRFVIDCLLGFVFSAPDDMRVDFNLPKFRYGQQEGEHAARLLVIKQLGGFVNIDIERFTEVSRHCNWWCPFATVCIMVDRPVSIDLDNNGLLHNQTGQACRYEDGWGFSALRGIQVPGSIARGEFGFDAIENEFNVERRRVMIERYGVGRYLAEANAILIHQDRYGRLYFKNQPNGEPLVFLEVLNATPEPDGTWRTYFLRVPPDMRTAHQAAAWTFQLDPETYNPAIQS